MQVVGTRLGHHVDHAAAGPSKLRAVITGENLEFPHGLDAQFALFQEGMELARFCEKKLGEVEKSVEIVLKSSDPEALAAAKAWFEQALGDLTA